MDLPIGDDGGGIAHFALGGASGVYVGEPLESGGRFEARDAKFAAGEIPIGRVVE